MLIPGLAFSLISLQQPTRNIHSNPVLSAQASCISERVQKSTYQVRSQVITGPGPVGSPVLTLPSVSWCSETCMADDPPGSFLFTGYQFNPTWFACPRPGRGYQVMRQVGGYENWQGCVAGLSIVALDYSGPSPAAGVYL